MDDFVLLDFLQDIFGEDEEEWDESFLQSIRSMALARPLDIENHYDSLISDEANSSEEYLLLEKFLIRHGRKNGLSIDSQRDKRKLVDMAISRRLETAIIVTIFMEHGLRCCFKDDFNVEREIEYWSESLSIHYAIDVKPSTQFDQYIAQYQAKGSKLTQMVIDACALDIGRDEEPSSNADPSHHTSLHIVQPSQVHCQSQVSEQSVAMSPITLHSHWTKLRSKTLRRRNTDTDLSKLIDLPPIPPSRRPSQIHCQTPGQSHGTPKRKGVLVKVGELSPSKLSQPDTQDSVIISHDTPVKLKKTASQSSSQFIASQSTQISEISLVVLETPPRASIGAFSCKVDHSVSKFIIG